MTFDFNAQKNELLFTTRGVTFYDAIEAIESKGILLNFQHPDQESHPDQHIFVVDIDGYAYCVPYVIQGDVWFLKTIYPSRKFKYLIGGETDETI